MDGRKRCKNASVDEKLFIRFQETENGGFRKRISVDRASIGQLRMHTVTSPNNTPVPGFARTPRARLPSDLARRRQWRTPTNFADF